MPEAGTSGPLTALLADRFALPSIPPRLRVFLPGSSPRSATAHSSRPVFGPRSALDSVASQDVIKVCQSWQCARPLVQSCGYTDGQTGAALKELSLTGED